jgi:hypothetical protein
VSSSSCTACHDHFQSVPSPDLASQADFPSLLPPPAAKNPDAVRVKIGGRGPSRAAAAPVQPATALPTPQSESGSNGDDNEDRSLAPVGEEDATSADEDGQAGSDTDHDGESTYEPEEVADVDETGSQDSFAGMGVSDDDESTSTSESGKDIDCKHKADVPTSEACLTSR